MRVGDLSAVQRGSKIVVYFTIPKLTTEGFPVPDRPETEVRIGEMPSGGFTVAAWEKGSERVPPTAVRIDNRVAAATIDASQMNGKTEVVAARVLGPHGRNVGWSNFQTVIVVPPLPVPQGLAATDAPDAVRLDWHAGASQFRVYRRTPDDPQWKQIAVTDKPFYVDPAIEYGGSYEYQVQSIEKSGDKYAESESSQTIAIKPKDLFPPAVPTGLTAVPGSRSIELAWDRSVEKDFSAYQVYRDGKKIADGLTSPSFSDKDVRSGVKYSYRISAIDNAGNVSALSVAVEAAIP
jgi:fibronectin type 3 domain-containing protein